MNCQSQRTQKNLSSSRIDTFILADQINFAEDQLRLTNSNITNTHKRKESDSVWDFLRSGSGKSLLEVLDVSFDDECSKPAHHRF